MNLTELTLKELFKLDWQVSWEIITRFWWMYVLIILAIVLPIIWGFIKSKLEKRRK